MYVRDLRPGQGVVSTRALLINDVRCLRSPSHLKHRHTHASWAHTCRVYLPSSNCFAPKKLPKQLVIKPRSCRCDRGRSGLRVQSEAAENEGGPTNMASPGQTSLGTNNNNYARASGQNVGNFLTDKPSSRVLAPPGGASTFRLG